MQPHHLRQSLDEKIGANARVEFQTTVSRGPDRGDTLRQFAGITKVSDRELQSFNFPNTKNLY